MDEGFILVTDAVGKHLHSRHSLVSTVVCHWHSMGSGKDGDHLVSFYFLDSFIGSIITLAASFPVFVITSFSLSFLEMEKVLSSFQKWS